jgi:hypothetical protein
MRGIVLAKLLGVVLLVLYLVIGLTQPPGIGKEANSIAVTNRCT